MTEAAASVRRFLRTHGGWLLGLCGVLLCVLGWYGVSGERHQARQLPYIASATIPGAALIVAGAVLAVGTRRGVGSPDASGGPGTDAELRAVMGQLYRLLIEPATAQGAPATVAAPDAPWVAVPGGARYHRPNCSLVRGKNGVYAMDSAFAEARDLRPCRLCDPDRPEAGSGSEAGAGKGTGSGSASASASASASDVGPDTGPDRVSGTGTGTGTGG